MPHLRSGEHLPCISQAASSRNLYMISCDGTESTPTTTLIDTAGRATVSMTKGILARRVTGRSVGEGQGGRTRDMKRWQCSRRKQLVSVCWGKPNPQSHLVRWSPLFYGSFFGVLISDFLFSRVLFCTFTCAKRRRISEAPLDGLGSYIWSILTSSFQGVLKGKSQKLAIDCAFPCRLQ